MASKPTALHTSCTVFIDGGTVPVRQDPTDSCRTSPPLPMVWAVMPLYLKWAFRFAANASLGFILLLPLRISDEYGASVLELDKRALCCCRQDVGSVRHRLSGEHGVAGIIL